MALFLTLQQAAKEANCTVRHFRDRLIKAGVPIHDFGHGRLKRYRLFRPDFEKWMKAKA